MCSPFLSLSPGCEHRHLLPSSRLPVSIPIHTVILPLQPTISSGSSSFQNKLAIQAPTCFSKYSPSLHLDLQSAFISQPFFPLMSLLLPPGMFLLCSSLPSLDSHKVPWRRMFFPLAFSSLNLCKCPISLCPWALSFFPLHLT